VSYEASGTLQGGASDTTRILVTGGSGFIGTNLVKHFIAAGHEVLNLDIAPPQIHNLCPWQEVDIRDATALSTAVAAFAPEIICHFAARVDLDGSTIGDYDANTIGVANLVKAAENTPSVRRVLFASSQLVCTPGHQPKDEFDFSPPNAYGESKVLGEQLVRTMMGTPPSREETLGSSTENGESDVAQITGTATATAADGTGAREAAPGGFTWVLLRPTSIWGPHFGPLYSAFLRSVRDGHYVHPKGHRVRKSFGFVGNAVHEIDKIAFASDAAVHGRVLYISDYEPYPIYEWAQLASQAFGSGPIREVPTLALRAAAVGGDVLRLLGWKHPPLTSYRLRNMLTETVFDLEPVKEIAGELPFSLEDATNITVEWMKANPNL